VAAPPYYRFFVGDYVRDAGHLSLLEHGAYRRLIDLYMVGAAPLPFDMPHLYRLLHATSKEEQAAVQVVVEEFFKMDGPVLRHKRCDRELSWQRKLKENQSERAKIRWENERKIMELNAVAMPQHSRGNAIQNQNQNQNQIEKQTPLSSERALTPCPQQEIVELWKKALPSLEHPRSWVGQRPRHLAARWRELLVDQEFADRESGLQWFGWFFDFIGKSPFLTGKVAGINGKPAFTASLDWVVKPENFAKIVDRNYHRGMRV
jgi:uncharacterized protein YdaU (DUF1376 family)